MSKGISVLLPVKNAESTVVSAINSVLSAMSDRDELLVCNDASDDSTHHAISGVRDKRIKLFDLEESIGPGLASNFLANESQNELIARVDGDDVVLPNRFGNHFRSLADEHNEFVFSNMILFGRGWAVPQRPRSFSPAQVREALATGNPLNNPTMIGPRNLFLKHGGYTQGVGCDKALWLRLALDQVPMRVVRSYTVLYRVHRMQRSRSSAPKDPIIKTLEKELRTDLGRF